MRKGIDRKEEIDMSMVIGIFNVSNLKCKLWWENG